MSSLSLGACCEGVLDLCCVVVSFFLHGRLFKELHFRRLLLCQRRGLCFADEVHFHQECGGFVFLGGFIRGVLI